MAKPGMEASGPLARKIISFPSSAWERPFPAKLQLRRRSAPFFGSFPRFAWERTWAPAPSWQKAVHLAPAGLGPSRAWPENWVPKLELRNQSKKLGERGKRLKGKDRLLLNPFPLLTFFPFPPADKIEITKQNERSTSP
jgi:hypothetical protein